MEMKKTIEYIAPEIECSEINLEGVLCASVDTEVEDGGDACGFE